MHVPRSAGLVTAGCLLLAVLGAWPAGAAPVALPDSAASGNLQLYAGTRPAVAPQGATSVKTIRTADGLLRSYRIFVPSGDVRAAPLVVALHGGLGSGVQFSQNSGLDGLATSNGFIVVYPEGVGRLPDGSGGAQTWNGGNCCGPAAKQGIDDVRFVRRVISDVAREYRIDRNRVYAVGHSNGGIMALRLACEASDVFAAVGVQSASLGMTRCAPSRPVAVMQIHGTADTNVPITGGIGAGISGVDFDPPRKAARTFAALDGCRARAVEMIGDVNSDLVLQRWISCRQGSSVVFLTVQSAGHAWMGHAATSPLAEELVGPPYMRLDSTRALWSFLAAHPRR